MGRIVSILLLVALALMPAASSICLAGADPACCAPVSEGSRSTAGETELNARDCDCCVTVDALPFDRALSASRPLAASAAVAVLPATASLLSRTSRAVDPSPRGAAIDSRLASIRTVVLLV
jgi:hypothetical protein